MPALTAEMKPHPMVCVNGWLSIQNNNNNINMRAIKMRMPAALNCFFRCSIMKMPHRMPGILMRFCTCVCKWFASLSAPKYILTKHTPKTLYTCAAHAANLTWSAQLGPIWCYCYETDLINLHLNYAYSQWKWNLLMWKPVINAFRISVAVDTAFFSCLRSHITTSKHTMIATDTL